MVVIVALVVVVVMVVMAVVGVVVVILRKAVVLVVIVYDSITDWATQTQLASSASRHSSRPLSAGYTSAKQMIKHCKQPQLTEKCSQHILYAKCANMYLEHNTRYQQVQRGAMYIQPSRTRQQFYFCVCLTIQTCEKINLQISSRNPPLIETAKL